MNFFGNKHTAAGTPSLSDAAASITLVDPETIRDGLTAGPWEIVGEFIEEFSAPQRTAEFIEKAGHSPPDVTLLKGTKCKMFVGLVAKPQECFSAEFTLAQQALSPAIAQPDGEARSKSRTMVFFTTEPRFTIVEMYADKSAAEAAFEKKKLA